MSGAREFSTTTRVAGFVLGLAAVFAVALGVGRVVGPLTEPTAAEHGHDGTEAATDGHGGSHGGAPGPATAGPATAEHLPGGLMSAQDGYAFRLGATTSSPGVDVVVSFTITGPDGKPVTAYDVQHDKRLHLIAVRRDNTGFQHVHPTLAADGTWSTGLDLTAGTWRLFADFKPTGAKALTLGTDLAVPGDYTPAAPVGEVRASTVDGYTATLAGDLVAGQDARLTLAVSKDGVPVTDLEPYLAAYGHLVALREGDLAYLHVHPDGEPGDGRTKPGPEIVFHTTVPSDGAYRLYLDFQHGGVVRTASFAVSAVPSGSSVPTSDPTAPATMPAAGHGGH